MYKAGRFYRCPASYEREVGSLRSKIAAGSELKRWFTTQVVDFQDFPSFVRIVRLFRSGLVRPKQEAGRVAAEVGTQDHDDGWDGPWDESDWQHWYNEGGEVESANE